MSEEFSWLFAVGGMVVGYFVIGPFLYSFAGSGASWLGLLIGWALGLIVSGVVTSGQSQTSIPMAALAAAVFVALMLGGYYLCGYVLTTGNTTAFGLIGTIAGAGLAVTITSFLENPTGENFAASVSALIGVSAGLATALYVAFLWLPIAEAGLAPGTYLVVFLVLLGFGPPVAAGAAAGGAAWWISRTVLGFVFDRR